MLKQKTKNICPLVQDLLEDCYCVRMGSQDIEKAVYFCSRNYQTCELYKINFLNNKGVLFHV